MSSFNRRRFLQVAGAAGLAPMLPSLPTRAAVASSGATNAQMLWASLYGQAGSAPAFAGLTGQMGLSSTAAQGVYAKLGGTQVLAFHSAVRASPSMPAISKVAPVSTGTASASLTPTGTRDASDQLVEVAEKVSEFFGKAECDPSSGHCEGEPLDPQMVIAPPDVDENAPF